MVFLTVVNLVRNRGPDRFFKKQQILRQTAKYFGRKRNCYSIALRYLEKALEHAREGRKQKKLDRRELWVQRITAASEELGTSYYTVHRGIAKCQIALNQKIMSELAVFEPRTFKCIVDIANTKEFSELPKEEAETKPAPDGVITRGML